MNNYISELADEYTDMVMNGASIKECEAFIKKSMDIIDNHRRKSNEKDTYII